MRITKAVEPHLLLVEPFGPESVGRIRTLVSPYALQVVVNH